MEGIQDEGDSTTKGRGKGCACVWCVCVCVRGTCRSCDPQSTLPSATHHSPRVPLSTQHQQVTHTPNVCPRSPLPHPSRLLRTPPREHAPRHEDVHERRSSAHPRTSLALFSIYFDARRKRAPLPVRPTPAYTHHQSQAAISVCSPSDPHPSGFLSSFHETTWSTRSCLRRVWVSLELARRCIVLSTLSCPWPRYLGSTSTAASSLRRRRG